MVETEEVTNEEERKKAKSPVDGQHRLICLLYTSFISFLVIIERTILRFRIVTYLKIEEKKQEKE